jgi:hypothetical protein
MLEASKLPNNITGSPVLDQKKAGRGVLEGLSNGQPKPVLDVNNKKAG